MKILTQAKDIVTVGFAIKKEEVERLKPDAIQLETRSHDGVDHAFLVLGLTHFNEFYAENFPPLSFDFHCAHLAICIEDERGESSYYMKRIFAPTLQSFLMKWVSGFPSRSLTMNFPTRAHAGGEYRWSLSGDGAGVLMGKIEKGHSVAGRLKKFFDDSQSMVNFFWNRNRLYAGRPDNLYEMTVNVSKPDFHPIVFDKLELGFLASDMERNTFPEAVLGSYFVPNASLSFENDDV